MPARERAEPPWLVDGIESLGLLQEEFLVLFNSRFEFLDLAEEGKLRYWLEGDLLWELKDSLEEAYWLKVGIDKCDSVLSILL